MAVKSQTLNPSVLAQVFKKQEHQPFYLAGGQPAALLVHGFPGTPAEMLPLAQVLSNAGWTVEGLLLPGFGEQIDTLYSRKYPEWIESIRVALHKLQLRHSPILLGGFSMGGALAINVAAIENVDGLLLLAPYWKLGGPLWRLLPLFKYFFPIIYPYRLIKLDFNNPEIRNGLGKFLPKVDLDDPVVQASIRDLPVPVGIIEEIHKLGRQTWNIAPQVNAQTLVLQGSQDLIVKPAFTRKLVKQLQTTTIYIEVSTGHDIPDPTNPAWLQVTDEVLKYSQGLIKQSGLR